MHLSNDRPLRQREGDQQLFGRVAFRAGPRGSPVGEGVEAGCPGAVHQAQSSHGGVAVQSPLVAGGGWGGPQAVAFMQAYVQVVNAVRAGSTGSTVRQSVDPPAAASPKCISASASAGLTRLESSSRGLASAAARAGSCVRQASKRAEILIVVECSSSSEWSCTVVFISMYPHTLSALG